MLGRDAAAHVKHVPLGAPGLLAPLLRLLKGKGYQHQTFGSQSDHRGVAAAGWFGLPEQSLMQQLQQKALLCSLLPGASVPTENYECVAVSRCLWSSHRHPSVKPQPGRRGATTSVLAHRAPRASAAAPFEAGAGAVCCGLCSSVAPAPVVPAPFLSGPCLRWAEGNMCA